MSYKIIGHRGNKADFVENTLAGFESALKANGVDGIELDVVVTKDKKLVISHDMFLVDVNGTKHNIYDITYSELCVLNSICVQSGIGDKYPLLHEALILYSKYSSEKLLLLEIKSLPSLVRYPASIANIIKEVHKLLDENKIIQKCYLISFDYRIIKESKKQNKMLKTGLILHRNLVPLDVIANSLDISLLIMEKDWITKEQVIAMKKKDISIFSWTPNVPNDWNNLFSLGVGAIITDRPIEAYSYTNLVKR